MLKVGYLIVLIVGSCLADIDSWNGGNSGYNLNDNLNNIKGLHYSQHGASVHAARKGAAERLQRISSSGSLGASCGSTICYSSSGFSDNSDAEALGHGVVGFSGGSAGSSSSSSKYQASSRQESVNSAVPVFPVSSGGKSSYVSSSQRQSASSVSTGQPLNYAVGADGIKTRSNFAAARESTFVQPIVASAYPIGQEASYNSFASANRDSSSGVYTVPVDTSNAYRTRSSYATASERETSSVAQPIVPVYNAGEQASKYVASGRQDNYQRFTPSNTYVVYGKPIPVYTAAGSNIESSARFANTDGAIYAPVKVYPVRTASQYSAANEQQSYSSTGTTPRPLYVSSSDQSSQSASNYRAATNYRPVYQPVYTNRLSSSNTEENEEENEEHSSQQIVPIVPTPVVGSSSKHHEEHSQQEEYSRRGSSYVPVAMNTGSTASHYAGYDQRRTQAGSSYVPVVGGSTSSAASQYASQDRRQDQRASYVPIAPLTSSSSSSSSKYSAHEQRQQQGSSYVPIVPTGESVSSSASKYSAQERRQQQLAGGSYYPVDTASHGSRYSASEAASAYNQQQQVKGGSFVPYPITNDALGQRFGSGGMSYGDNNDLGELMSESERLAKLQARNAYNGAVSGSSSIDTANRFGADQGSSSGSDAGSGGFKRTKSWSSSSKWASGQKYDDAGKIKSYSSLSTAESEQHNIDGKKTGYKAATTTLEDDGKVSTYSLHTP